MSELYVRNRQRTRSINVRLLESVASAVIVRTCPADYHVGILLVAAKEMARLNEAFLGHAGPTDVLAFGYTAGQAQSLHGEVFICVDEAIEHARRFRTTWQKELVRYLTHGLLHFQGYDDATPAKRQRMKAVEDAIVEELAGQFSLRRLERKPKVRS